MPPSPNGPNGGRDARGRFAPGNAGGPGNPLAGRVHELRQAVLDAVSPERLAKVVEALLVLAEGGDVAAARLVLDRCLGPAEALDLLQRVEAVEERLGLREEAAP